MGKGLEKEKVNEAASIERAYSIAAERSWTLEHEITCSLCGCTPGTPHSAGCHIRAINVNYHAHRPDLFQANGDAVPKTNGNFGWFPARRDQELERLAAIIFDLRREKYRREVHREAHERQWESEEQEQRRKELNEEKLREFDLETRRIILGETGGGA